MSQTTEKRPMTRSTGNSQRDDTVITSSENVLTWCGYMSYFIGYVMLTQADTVYPATLTIVLPGNTLTWRGYVSHLIGYVIRKTC